MAETEKILRKYPFEQYCLQEWNKFYLTNPELGIQPKDQLAKVDWVWLVQDFHLFVHRQILGRYKKSPNPIQIKEELEEFTAIEGTSKLATHLSYERNTTLVKKVKKKALAENEMLNCQVCGFSFLATYGEIGAGFIEAHHIHPLSERTAASPTKAEDLALVCSNCHRMLHTGIPVYSLEELKVLMNRSKNNADKD